MESDAVSVNFNRWCPRPNRLPRIRHRVLSFLINSVQTMCLPSVTTTLPFSIFPGAVVVCKAANVTPEATSAGPLTVDVGGPAVTV